MTITKLDLSEVFRWTRRCPRCGNKPTWNYLCSYDGVPYQVRMMCPECSWIRVGPYRTLKQARKEWNRLVKTYKRAGLRRPHAGPQRNLFYILLIYIDCFEVGIYLLAGDKRMGDDVDHPDHYGGKGNLYEAIKVIEAWDLDFHLGNRWYLDRAIEQRVNTMPSETSLEALRSAFGHEEDMEDDE